MRDAGEPELPTIFTVLAALAFFTLERLAPGRELPNSRGW